MNTIKKCILLGILMLNLIPYMQDGKVKWTTTEARAQSYTLENPYDVMLPIVNPVNQYCHYEGSYLKPNKNWCFYYVMSALGHGDACDNAHWYLATYKPTFLNTGCVGVGGVADEGVDYNHKNLVFTHFGVSLGSSVSDRTTLARKINDGYGLICIFDSHTHIYLYYGMTMDFSISLLDMNVLKFDSNNGQTNFYKQEQLKNTTLPTDNWLIQR